MKILIFLIFVFLGACTNGTEPTTTISKIDTAAATLALTTILSILQSDTIWEPTLKLQKIQTQDPALRAALMRKKVADLQNMGKFPDEQRGYDYRGYFKGHDSLLWEVLIEEKEIFPYIIERMSDVGDVNFGRLGNMQGLLGNTLNLFFCPPFSAHIWFRAKGDEEKKFIPYYDVYSYMFKHRKFFKKNAELWYQENKDNFCECGVPEYISVYCYHKNGKTYCERNPLRTYWKICR